MPGVLCGGTGGEPWVTRRTMGSPRNISRQVGRPTAGTSGKSPQS